MGNNEIKSLFIQADKQITVNQTKRQQTYEALALELSKQKTPIISKQNILFSQFRYMDKSFLGIYSILISLEAIIILAMQNTGAGIDDIIVTCMISAGIFSAVSIITIDKIFFGTMAELGESCYFNTKQCVALYLMISGIISLTILMSVIIYVCSRWRISLIQIGLYVLTPYLLSSIVSLGILSTKTGRRNPYFFVVSAAFLSIGYSAFPLIPNLFSSSLLGLWGTVCAASGLLFVMQLKSFFRQMDKGEMLCTN